MITLTINITDEERDIILYETRKPRKRRSSGQIVNGAIRKYRAQFPFSIIDVSITYA